MNPWPFVIAAYAVTIGGTAAAFIWAWLAMRAAEKAAAGLRRER
ncbi:hypothetical protein [Sphingomonas flavalba]|nr:hypothetical protein [Sphingomonas flavalba]